MEGQDMSALTVDVAVVFVSTENRVELRMKESFR